MTHSSVPPAACRVLLIDDDEGIRNVVAAFLRHEGYVVDAITDGSGALKQLAKQAYDLVITDIMMPNSDGLETIRKIRARQPSQRIIAMSGGDSYGNCYLRVAQLLGAASVLQKPFELVRLGEFVRTALALPLDARDRILLPN
jgi:DNA-binding response OmpR family regulator